MTKDKYSVSNSKELSQRDLGSCVSLIWICVMISMMCLINIGQSVAQELSIYDKGLSQYSLSRYDRAAKEWTSLGERLERLGSRNDSQLKRAAFANVLATIAYEKDNDSRAYDAWSSAIRLYLQTQTKWESQRSMIAKRIAGLNDNVKSYTGENVPSGALRPDDYILLKMNDLMKLADYDGPRAGLANKKTTDTETHSEFHDTPSLFGDEKPAKEVYKPQKVGSRRGLRDPSILLNQRDAIRQARRSSRQAASVPKAQEAQRRYNNPSGTDDFFGTDRDENIYEDVPQAAGLKTIEPYGGTKGDHIVGESDTAFPPEYVRIARVAWRYIENNRNKETGLVNGLDQQALASTGDIGHALMAYIAAHDIGVIATPMFKSSVETLLNTLSTMALYKDVLPNSLYHTSTLDLLDFEGEPSTKGAGWNAEGIGRLLMALKILSVNAPEYKSKVKKIVDGWTLPLLVGSEGIVDEINILRREKKLSTARLGYEQYIAHALSFWDVEADVATDYDDVHKVMVNNVTLPADSREGAYLLLDPFVLGEIEFGGRDKTLRDALARLYSVHVRRWQDTKKVAISGRLSTKEQGVYWSYAVYHNKKPWQIVNPDGSSIKNGEGAWISTKNAFAMAILYPGAFGDAVFNQAQLAQSASHGFYTGIDNNDDVVRSLDLETNASILEALLYMKNDFEPLVKGKGM